MKFLKKNYVNCIRKYYGETQKNNEMKIIGKVDYDYSFINSSINDSNLGLIISGHIPSENYDKETKKYLTYESKDIDYKIIKECGKNI